MIEYFSQNVWLIWVLVSIICLLLELTSGDLFILCFAIGGVFGSIASALGFGIVGQILVFAAFTLLSIFFVRPVALRWLHRKDAERPSNADALMGRTGFVSEAIEANGYGRVAVDGDDWKAESEDGNAIGKGDRVEIVGRESIVIKVRKA